MPSYLARLTIEGESDEQLVLADDPMQAMRLALEDNWRYLTPTEAVVLSVRESAAVPA